MSGDRERGRGAPPPPWGVTGAGRRGEKAERRGEGRAVVVSWR